MAIVALDMSSDDRVKELHIVNDVHSKLPAQVSVSPLKWTIDTPSDGSEHTGPSLLDLFHRKGTIFRCILHQSGWSLMSASP